MKKVLLIGTSAIALAAFLAMPIAANSAALTDYLILASDDGGGQGGQGTGQGGQGSGKGQGSGQGSGQGGNNSGNQKGSKGQDGMANRPNWAGQELADIGRLNVIKSPLSVLQRSIDNAEEYDSAIYSLSVQDFISKLTSLDQIIDSPLTNVAVLREYWSEGTVALNDVTPASFVDFSAIVIGIAVDKTTEVTPDIVSALATIVGIELTDKQISDIATAADAVRDKVVEVHDAT
jgi:hypothetical protein